MKCKKILTTILAASMLLGNTAIAADTYVTRGEVADMLLCAADDYNPSVGKNDIIKGYGDESGLHEEQNVTRAEALVMVIFIRQKYGGVPWKK